MIRIQEYDQSWPEVFERIRASLATILGPLALRIDHIGSTSVPGMAAKEVIYVQITVEAVTAEVTERLIDAGYRHKPHVTHHHVPAGADADPELWRKLFFIQPDGERRVNLHVRAAGRPNQRYPLLFRDYLRAHPDAAKTIARIKRELAARFPHDIGAYYAVKDPVYDLIWRAAQAWESGEGRSAGK
jgi:GrpB-like predicted nucleotidyltransferase (UPF0157 family)